MLRNRLYYALKPLVPWSVRMAARRLLARRRLSQVSGVWPILPGSEKKPAGWPGWPEGRQFAFVLTHDVEGIAGLGKVRLLAELEMSLGFRSSFNFVPEGDYQVPGELLDWLNANGFEVGVHDLRHDGKLYRNRHQFSLAAARINRYLKNWGAVGFRSGFMLNQLDWLHELDLHYDASTFDTDPFEPQPQGQNTIFPFWVSNPRPHSQLATGNSELSSPGYLELPYTLAQDSTLFLLLREPTPAIWLQKLDWVAGHGGMALVNVHPDYLRFPGEAISPRTFPVEHYVALLQRVREHHAGCFWRALPREVAGFIRARTRVAGESAVQSTS